MGRAYKFTAEVQEKLLNAAKAGLHKQVCAWEAGISPSSLDGWLKTGDEDESSEFYEFARAFRAAEAFAVRKLHDRLTGLATGEQEGNPTPGIELLKRRWPKLYGDRAALEHTGADGGPLRHEVGPAEIQAAVVKRFGGAAAVQQIDEPDESESDDSSEPG